MLCANCQKNEATVHLTEIEGNQVVKVHLCADCARSKGVAIPVTQALANLIANLPAQEETDAAAVACPKCGLTLADYRQSGRLGCGECYRAFSVPLGELISRLQQGESHTGKRPGGEGPTREQIAAALAAAVEREDYEQAARLRDLQGKDGANSDAGTG